MLDLDLGVLMLCYGPGGGRRIGVPVSEDLDRGEDCGKCDSIVAPGFEGKSCRGSDLRAQRDMRIRGDSQSPEGGVTRAIAGVGCL